MSERGEARGRSRPTRLCERGRIARAHVVAETARRCPAIRRARVRDRSVRRSGDAPSATTITTRRLINFRPVRVGRVRLRDPCRRIRPRGRVRHVIRFRGFGRVRLWRMRRVMRLRSVRREESFRVMRLRVMRLFLDGVRIVRRLLRRVRHVTVARVVVGSLMSRSGGVLIARVRAVAVVRVARGGATRQFDVAGDAGAIARRVWRLAHATRHRATGRGRKGGQRSLRRDARQQRDDERQRRDDARDVCCCGLCPEPRATHRKTSCDKSLMG